MTNNIYVAASRDQHLPYMTCGHRHHSYEAAEQCGKLCVKASKRLKASYSFPQEWGVSVLEDLPLGQEEGRLRGELWEVWEIIVKQEDEMREMEELLEEAAEIMRWASERRI